ncbi:hypothetical protein LaR116_13960, partial [Lacticaseibacillus rhamnosus]
TGVGTIAAGVVKAGADTVVISGYDGGTGAAPRNSTRDCGLPWEMGLADAHQTLALNRLRQRTTLEVDGKLLTGARHCSCDYVRCRRVQFWHSDHGSAGMRDD